MLKYLVLSTIIFSSFNSFSQSLKFNELLKIYRKEWAETKMDSVLRAKGFEKTEGTFCNSRELLYINISDKDEKLFVQNNAITYEISDFVKGNLFWEYNFFEIDGIEKDATFKQEPSKFKENLFVFENYFSSSDIQARTGMFMNFSGPNMKPPAKKIFCIQLFDKTSCNFRLQKGLSIPRSKNVN
jgi:hypothetical protein